MRRLHRPGLSVFELLVIIAILGILIALLLPAVQKVREAAARTASLSKLMQLAIAVHNHQDAMGSFPSGNDMHNFSAITYLLPFLEADNLFKTIDMKKDMTDRANADARKTAIKHLLSPQDPRANVTDEYGATNYLFCAGSKPGLVDNDGTFMQEAWAKAPDSFGDGLSQTMMIAESLKGDGGQGGRDVRRQHVLLKDKDALKDLNDDSGVDDFKNGRNVAGDRGSSWMDGRFLQATFTATRGFNDPRPDVNCAGAGGLSGIRSYARVALVAFADASTRPISTKADLKVWKALATTNGKEKVNINDY